MASSSLKTHASTNLENRTKKKVGAEGLAYTQEQANNWMQIRQARCLLTPVAQP